LSSSYEPKFIYNADETRSSFRALPTKSLTVKGEKCTRGENVQRKTCSVTVCEYGERNGKTPKPRCFKNPKINNSQVIWRNNKNAWMTAAKIEEWLKM
jgi:hypothetical protein